MVPSPQPLEQLSKTAVVVASLAPEWPDNVECSVATDKRLSPPLGTVVNVVKTSFELVDPDDDVDGNCRCFFVFLDTFGMSQNLNVSLSGVTGS